jgi:hypothetical protein
MNHYVCLICGYNMVDRYPEKCPFCGAERHRFLTAEECSEQFTVVEIPVTQSVTRLNSQPALGMEHAGYRVQAGKKEIWVDCPSTWSEEIPPPDLITFTHHHFLGASMLYRQRGGSKVQINRRDAVNGLTVGYEFDHLFEWDHDDHGLAAHYINGHTWGFTFYTWENVLFVCDYVFERGEELKLNPFGDRDATIGGARRMIRTLDQLELEYVCAYNYVAGYDEWRVKLDRLLAGST